MVIKEMIFKNMKSFIISHPFLFGFFMLLQILTMISLLFSYCEYQNQRLQDRAYNDKVTQVTVSFEKTNLSNMSEYLKELEKSEKDYSRIKLMLSPKGGDISFFKGTEYVANSGRKFEKSVAPEVIVNDALKLQKKVRIGDSFENLGQTFKVVGTRGAGNYIEYNFKGLKEFTEVYGVKVSFEKLPSNKALASFSEMTQKFFKDAIITMPQERNAINEIAFDSSFLSSAFLMILSLINLTFIFNYLLGERKTANSIYLLCGCKSSRLFSMYFFEAVIYCISTSIISILIFHFFIKDFIFISAISFTHYLFPTLLYLFASLLVMFISISKMANKSPSKVLQEEI